MTDASNIDGLRKKLLASTNHRKPILIGLTSLALFAGVFGVGAGTAPIEGAALAAGHFVARGQNQLVQHLEGGIVSEILVKEGDVVRKGDVLIRLDTTRAKSELERLTGELHSGMAREARLLAERDSLDHIVYPPALLDMAKAEPAMALLMADQDKEFSARLGSRATKIEILERKNKAAETEIEGYKIQRAANKTQRDLLQQEIDSVQALFDKGLTAAERLYRLKRNIADLEGQDGKLASQVGSIEQSILENMQEIEGLENTRVEDAAKDIVELRLSLAQTRDDMTKSSDIVRRSVVVAPVDGVVFKRHVNTIGAVLAQGGDVVELLPQPSNLVVEVMVLPQDIDRIYNGQEAAIRIPALHIPYSPLMPGRIEYVSADRMTNQDTGEEYYVARISDIALPSDIDQKRLYPGMQVESFIVTGPRTFAEYIFDPIWQSFTRSLREK